MMGCHRLNCSGPHKLVGFCLLATLMSMTWFGPGLTQADAAPDKVARQAADSASPPIELAIDARDVRHRVIAVHEIIPVVGAPSEIALEFPKWIPGDHAPSGPIGRIAGLVIQANGIAVAWRRVASDVYTFHVPVAPGVTKLDITFQYLGPSADVRGGAVITRNIIAVKWAYLLLYPSGSSTLTLPVHARARFPDGFTWTTSLAPEARAENSAYAPSFAPVALDTLVDSPVYAGAFTRSFVLDAMPKQPVHLTLFGERPDQLEMTPEQLTWHRSLIREAVAVFGSGPFAHYDLLATLSSPFGIDGLEHRQSSEIFLNPDYLTDWAATWDSRYLIAHEFVHAWNGKWRVPGGLRSPDLNTDLHLDLLWVYEGQTQYWAKVLSTRSGIWTMQQMLDDLALVTAEYARLPARAWRTLLDSTLDPVINPREEIEWQSWQRYQDYYDEGSLVWLEVDTVLRSASHGKHSLDEFARVFFAGGADTIQSKSYELADIIAVLRGIMPYDWESFFRDRIALLGHWDPADAVRRAGYDLVFNDQPSPTCTAERARRGLHCFNSSIGLTVDNDGLVDSVEWNGIAFQSGLSAGMRLMAVNGSKFSPEVLLSAIVAAESSPNAIEIVSQDQDHVDTLRLPYHGGPRYPHLLRISGSTDWLGPILRARTNRAQ